METQVMQPEMKIGEKAFEIVKKNINLPGMGEQMLVELVFPMIDQAVQKSDNKIDDAIWPLAKQALKDALLDLIKKA